jgi:hypothetical protein
MIDMDMTRRGALEIVLAGGVAAMAGSAANAANAANPPTAGGDWQFLVGRWQVRHRKLRERLVGSSDWMEFDGSCENWPMLGGAANVDDNIFHTPGETYRGVGLRAYDPAARQWAIWWLDSRAPDRLDVPVRGTFKDGVGTFLAEDSWKGTPVTVRFRWSDITARSAKWEQAFSTDGGATWEVNWVMHFTRA